MAIALTLERYLDAHNVKYDVIAHAPTNSSMQTAKTCRISGDRLAKAVLLRDDVGYALAVLPASHQIRLAELKRQFGDDVDLATEREIEDLFQDCARGAIPAVGECYGLDLVVDDSTVQFWFVKTGVMYEVIAMHGEEAWVTGILKTWQFD